MANRYWVGGTGTWDGTNTTNWSATSGGAGGASVPTSADAVLINTSSGSGTITLGANAVCSGLTLSATNAITLTTNNFNITASGGTITISGTATINLGSSTVTCAKWRMQNAGATFNAGTSTVRANGGAGVAPEFFGLGKTYYSGIVQNGSSAGATGSMTGANVFGGNLTLDGGGNGGSISLDSSISVSGSLTLTGTAANRVRVIAATRGTSVTITASGSRSASYIDFEDIAIGGSVLTGTSLGNYGGNSNITFTAAVNRYAVATGNWSSASVWSATDGGAAGASRPLPQDTAYLTATSGAITVTNDVFGIGNIDCTGFTGTFTTSGAHRYYGSVALSSGMTYGSGAGNFTYFYSRKSGNSLNFSNQSIVTPTFDGVGGAWAISGSVSTAYGFDLINGSLDLGSSTITTPVFTSNGTGTRSLTLGGSTINLTSTNAGAIVWDVSSTGLTLSSGTSTIALTSTSTNSRTFAGAGFSYNKLVFGGSTGIATFTVTGSNTFAEIASTKTVAYTVKFTGGTTTTIGKWSMSGSSGNVVTITSTDTSQATLAYTGGLVSADYLNVSYINASPDLTWYVGANSTNGGNNTQVYFEAAPIRSNGLFFGSNF